MCIHLTAEEEMFEDPHPHPLIETELNKLVGSVPRRFVVVGRWVSKKNGKAILKSGGRFFIGSNPKYRRWETEAVMQLRAQYKGKDTITNPVKVTTAIYLDRKQRRPDRDNARSGPFDALQKAKVIKNDSQIEDDPLHFFRDANQPRVELFVEELLDR